MLGAPKALPPELTVCSVVPPITEPAHHGSTRPPAQECTC